MEEISKGVWKRIFNYVSLSQAKYLPVDHFTSRHTETN